MADPAVSPSKTGKKHYVSVLLETVTLQVCARARYQTSADICRLDPCVRARAQYTPEVSTPLCKMIQNSVTLHFMYDCTSRVFALSF